MMNILFKYIFKFMLKSPVLTTAEEDIIHSSDSLSKVQSPELKV